MLLKSKENISQLDTLNIIQRFLSDDNILDFVDIYTELQIHPTVIEILGGSKDSKIIAACYSVLIGLTLDRPKSVSEVT